jgi:acetyl-CoA carboxylase/biotin carboxylase 1
MRAKGVIRRQVQWAESRKFFYWRLRRRLIEFDVANRLAKFATAPGAASAAAGLAGTAASGASSTSNTTSASGKSGFRKETTAELQLWHAQVTNNPAMWEDDRELVDWFHTNPTALESFLAGKRAQLLVSQVGERLDALAGLETKAVKEALKALTPEARAALLQALKE